MDETKRDKGLFARMAAAADELADDTASASPNRSDTSQQGGPPWSIQDNISRIDHHVSNLYGIDQERDMMDQSLARRIGELEARVATLEE